MVLRQALRLFVACAGTLTLMASNGVSVSVAGAGLQGMSRVGGRPARNVVVWLEAPNRSARMNAPKVVLEQRNLMFYPQVLAVRVGTSVEFPNDDRVFHNVFSFHAGKQFDLGLYPVGTVRHVTFDRPGLSRIF